jgi:hypothetical protein
MDIAVFPGDAELAVRCNRRSTEAASCPDSVAIDPFSGFGPVTGKYTVILKDVEIVAVDDGCG